MIKNWQDLEVGKHYKLSCGCTGEVVCLRNSHKSDSRRGFYMAYSNMFCGRLMDTQESYAKGYGPYCNFFNYRLCEDAMPAEEIPEPSWWKVLPSYDRIQEIRSRKFSEMPLRTTKCVFHHDDHSDLFGFSTLKCLLKSFFRRGERGGDTSPSSTA